LAVWQKNKQRFNDKVPVIIYLENGRLVVEVRLNHRVQERKLAV